MNREDSIGIERGFSYSLSSLLVLATLLPIACGLVVAAPGLGIPFCILLAPVLVRTAMVVRRRKERGETVSMGQKLALVGSSLIVAAVIATVVSVAAVGTFCGICLGLYAVGGEPAAGPGSIIAGLAALVVTISLGTAFAKWIARRYRRDVDAGEIPLPRREGQGEG